jgi:hypothetical protein
MSQTSSRPGDFAAKKEMLLRVFKEFASAEMDSDLPRFFAAAEQGVREGMTMEDVAFLQDLSTDGAAFRAAYGGEVLPAGLAARMKAHDEKLLSIGVPRRFPGFYPA